MRSVDPYERKGKYNGSALREALDIATRNNIMLTTGRSAVTLMKPDVTTEEIQSEWQGFLAIDDCFDGTD